MCEVFLRYICCYLVSVAYFETITTYYSHCNTKKWINIKAHEIQKQASSLEEEEDARPPTLRHS